MQRYIMFCSSEHIQADPQLYSSCAGEQRAESEIVLVSLVSVGRDLK